MSGGGEDGSRRMLTLLSQRNKIYLERFRGNWRVDVTNVSKVAEKLSRRAAAVAQFADSVSVLRGDITFARYSEHTLVNVIGVAGSPIGAGFALAWNISGGPSDDAPPLIAPNPAVSAVVGR